MLLDSDTAKFHYCSQFLPTTPGTTARLCQHPPGLSQPCTLRPPHHQLPKPSWGAATPLPHYHQWPNNKNLVQVVPEQGCILRNKYQGKSNMEGDTAERWQSCSNAL